MWYIRYAELTGSRTKPLPAHRPWSGGSNSAPKFVCSLSRLLTPLKFSSNVLVLAVPDELTTGACVVRVAALPWVRVERAPRWRAEGAVELAAAGWLVTGWMTPCTPEYCVAAGADACARPDGSPVATALEPSNPAITSHRSGRRVMPGPPLVACGPCSVPQRDAQMQANALKQSA